MFGELIRFKIPNPSYVTLLLCTLVLNVILGLEAVLDQRFVMVLSEHLKAQLLYKEQ